MLWVFTPFGNCAVGADVAKNAALTPVAITPATTSVREAFCYVSARKAIERRGTSEFPSVDGRRLYGELEMKIVVRANGDLEGSSVEVSSGNAALDNAAKKIVRGSAPFPGCVNRTAPSTQPSFEFFYRFKFIKAEDTSELSVDGL
ncbi:energy transducer TonB [Pseudoduganella sp. HUAS MS19]